MADLLATASTWLDRTLKSSASQTVRYRRGADYVDVSAEFGNSADAAESSPEVKRAWQQTDFLIVANDLVLSGSAIDPQRGDKIEHTANGQTTVYGVLPDELTGKCFRFADDSTKYKLRVHTKESA